MCQPVSGYQVQVEQVILNLLSNARDVLDARNDDYKQIDISLVDRGDIIAIFVEDTGGGIEPDVINRIFEPFFTTKESGKGTGLGLSISYGIISDMGGELQVTNTEAGARFAIILPACEEGTVAV